MERKVTSSLQSSNWLSQSSMNSSTFLTGRVVSTSYRQISSSLLLIHPLPCQESISSTMSPLLLSLSWIKKILTSSLFKTKLKFKQSAYFMTCYRVLKEIKSGRKSMSFGFRKNVLVPCSAMFKLGDLGLISIFLSASIFSFTN